MQKTNYFAWAVGLAIALALLVWAAKTGAERQEVKDCYQWQSWAQQSNLFKPSADMQTMCAAHNILIK